MSLSFESGTSNFELDFKQQVFSISISYVHKLLYTESNINTTFKINGLNNKI